MFQHKEFGHCKSSRAPFKHSSYSCLKYVRVFPPEIAVCSQMTPKITERNSMLSTKTNTGLFFLFFQQINKEKYLKYLCSVLCALQYCLDSYLCALYYYLDSYLYALYYCLDSYLCALCYCSDSYLCALYYCFSYLCALYYCLDSYISANC